MSIGFDDLDQLFAKCEKSLNVPGYIPLVGTLTGSFRIIAGKIMVLCASIAALGFFIASSVNKESGYKISALHCVDYVLNGIADILRGMFEFIPLVNLLLIPYDATHNRFTYPYEVTKIEMPDNQVPVSAGK